MPSASGPHDGASRDALDRSRFVLEFDESFSDPELDPDRWVTHYLPQWTIPARSAAR